MRGGGVFFFKLKITNTGAIEHKIVYSKPVKEAPRQIIEEELSSHNDSTKHTLQKDFMHFMLPYEDIAIYFRFWNVFCLPNHRRIPGLQFFFWRSLCHSCLPNRMRLLSLLRFPWIDFQVLGGEIEYFVYFWAQCCVITFGFIFLNWYEILVCFESVV